MNWYHFTIGKMTEMLGSPDLVTSYSSINDPDGRFESRELRISNSRREQQGCYPTDAESLESLKMASDYCNAGNDSLARGDFDSALDYHTRALSILERVLPPDHTDLALGYSNVGSAYCGLGQYEHALDYQKKALEIMCDSLEGTHPSIALQCINVGNLYLNLGDYESGLEYHQRALTSMSNGALHDHPDCASEMAIVGLIYEKLGDTRQAERYYTEAILILEELGSGDQLLTELQEKVRQLGN